MATAKKVEAAPVTSYTIDYLMANAAVFGVPPEIVRGALYDKKEATKEEAEAAIDKFLNRPKSAKKEGGK
ncbi:hypothetical protein M3221_13550 [Domibacillus indicus]|uniref:hypothetical protein n=1 Tax=Domibacillus indicus TaxID=1437523 RepID=UPI002040A962|nr:hypothetical protein [Domibacillus indicus]MCM3789425.1 hypothetical protein [Domibacillus indicus]